MTDGERRCSCHKKLLVYNDSTEQIEIKCPKCGEMNYVSITEIVNFETIYKK